MNRPQIAAIYCPLWHNYDHASAWKGEGWCEWELLRNAIPRFPGHYQPLKPTWGCFDESDPAWAAREIELASSHGIDVFIFDWYWYSGVRIMEEALEQGFLRSGVDEKMKFAIMWANHDWSDYFPAPFDKPWNMWLPIRHSLHDLQRVMDYSIEHYFSRPNYWQLNGRLFYSLFSPTLLIDHLGGPEKTRKAFAEVDRQLESAGLPPLHWNAMCGSDQMVPLLEEAGFHSTTTYNVIASGKAVDLIDSYEDLIQTHHTHWQIMSRTSLPHMPVVTMGWDVTPRCEKDIPWPFPPSPAKGYHDYPYMSLVTGNTPDRFEQLCRDALNHTNNTQSQAIFINAWNEWTEGSYLLPEERDGTAYLEAVKRALAE